MQLRQSSRATGVINRRKALALLAVGAWQVAPSWAAGFTEGRTRKWRPDYRFGRTHQPASAPRLPVACAAGGGAWR